MARDGTFEDIKEFRDERFSMRDENRVLGFCSKGTTSASMHTSCPSFLTLVLFLPECISLVN